MLTKEELNKALDGIRHQISDKICPKCRNGRPNVFEEEKAKYKYYIMCTYCSTKWKNVNEFVSDSKEFRKMRHIKNQILKSEQFKNKNNIGNVLHKNLDKIVSKESSLIVAENKETFKVAVESMLKLYSNDSLIIGKMKLCSRADLLLLQKIIDLAEKEGKEVTWSIPTSNRNLTLKLVRYTSQNCIIADLSEVAMLNIRAVLRSLINKGLIACCEKSNHLDIHSSIIKNKSIITKLLEYQEISNDVKYKVFSHYNFMCVHCGEDKRSLRIAYTSSDKTKQKCMIPVCEFCYDSITVDEVLIDGTVTLFENKDSMVSWQFIVNFFPKISNNLQAYKFNYILSLKYNDHDLIKAIAITLEKVKSGTKLFKIGHGATFFYKYVEKVIQNKDIIIGDEIKTKYNLDYWLKVV